METQTAHFLLNPLPLSVSAVSLALASPDAGGQVIFTGVVRSHNKERQVLHLEFDAYAPMVYAELTRIATALRERWQVHNVVLHHRTGTVNAGETAVIAAVSATHRKPAFESCQFLMDELKRSVPIWKKEVYADGSHWVSPTP